MRTEISENSVLGRMVKNIDTIKDSYRSGVSKRTLANELNVSCAHFLTMWRQLETMGYITANDERMHELNKNAVRNEKIEETITNKHLNIEKFIRDKSTDLYKKVILTYCISPKNELVKKVKSILTEAGYAEAEKLPADLVSNSVSKMTVGFSSMRYEVLVAHILGTTDARTFKDKVGDYVLTKDQIDGIDYLIKNKLTDVEQYVITSRYLSCDYVIPLDKIADKMGVTKTRAGQVLKKALYVLASMPDFNYVQFGLYGYRKMLSDGTRSRFNSRNMYKELSIDEIGLSARAYSSLNNAGVKTVKDICSLENIMSIRGIGDRTANEIKDVLTSLNITLC